MRTSFVKIALGLVLALGLSVGTAAELEARAPVRKVRKAAPPAKIDWTRFVSRTPAGGMLIGNRSAARKLVAFVSYTCPHCGKFEADSAPELMNGLVKTGKVSIEIRNLVRDRYDLAAAVLSRCGGAPRFLTNHLAIFGAQAEWLAAAQLYDSRYGGAVENTSQIAALRDIADKTGLFALLNKQGLNNSQLNRCIADRVAMQTVLNSTQDALTKRKITGTPFFVLDGVPTQVHDWSSLKVLLPALPAKTG